MIDAQHNPHASAQQADQSSELSINENTHQFRIALAHDWLVARRGGELVLDAIIQSLSAHQLPISKLYSMFDTGVPITPQIDQLTKSLSPLNNYPNQLRRWLLFRYPQAVAQLSTQLEADHQQVPVDLLISTHSSAIKAMQAPISKNSQSPIPHICYCHTPARYLWSQQSSYTKSTPNADFSQRFKSSLRRIGLGLFAPSLREWDQRTAKGVSHFVANSSHTAQQIKEHYHRDSIVIHPPVRTDFFTPTSNPRQDHLLLVSALEPYKRVDLAIDAAKLADRPIVIVGTGSHESALKQHAKIIKAPVRFLGHISDDELKTQYQIAHAFLFPQIEDFGITAVEAQATGCPVIARRAGGALDTVIDSETGVFFDEPSPQALAHAINQTPTHTETAHHCRTNALQFSEHQFQLRISTLIKDCLNHSNQIKK